MKRLEKRSGGFGNWVGFISGIIIIAIGIVSLNAGNAQGEQKIKFKNMWRPSGSWAMFWSAQDRFWPEEGVYGEVEDSKGSTDTVRAVAAGSSQMGYAMLPACLAARVKGAPIQIIAIGEQNDASTLFALKSSGIKALKDFEGKRVGGTPFGGTKYLVQAMLRKNGVDLSKIKFTNVSAGSEVAMLSTEKIDGFTGMLSYQDLLLLKKGQDIVVFPVKDNGIQIPSGCIIANTSWMDEVGRETVLKYLRGIAKGFILSKTDVKKMIEDMIKYRTDQKLFYESALAQTYSRWLAKYKSDIVDEYGWGWIDKKVMEFSQNTLFDAGLLKEKTAVENYYTLEFLTDRTVRPLAIEYADAELDPNMKKYYESYIKEK